MAKFDPFLSLDCARVEGVGAQEKEGIKFCHLATLKQINDCRANGSSVSGSISTPSDEPQGGNYRISSCGNGCHVLMRLDQTKFGDI